MVAAPTAPFELRIVRYSSKPSPVKPSAKYELTAGVKVGGGTTVVGGAVGVGAGGGGVAPKAMTTVLRTKAPPQAPVCDTWNSARRAPVGTAMACGSRSVPPLLTG